jgi:hypothetical protein
LYQTADFDIYNGKTPPSFTSLDYYTKFEGSSFSQTIEKMKTKGIQEDCNRVNDGLTNSNEVCKTGVEDCYLLLIPKREASSLLVCLNQQTKKTCNCEKRASGQQQSRNEFGNKG